VPGVVSRPAGQRKEHEQSSKIPVGRIGRPEEIARVVAFLADDESLYITGQIWAVNGGLDM
jgi:NAD(P)-dependent dehydrogenase (short-subunit alcohol dehydrogenase family)